MAVPTRQIRTAVSIRDCLHPKKLEALVFIALESPLATWFQDSGNKIFELPELSVFFSAVHRMPSMRVLFGKAVSLRTLCRTCLLGIAFLACSLTLLADTPGLLRKVPAGGCFCRCEESHQRRGCVKLCDSKRFASRWWAIKCAKPRMRRPPNNSNAGPRFPHPGRAEHAQLHP